LRQARILVADDNADMRDYLQRLLGQRWRVEAVADGEQALSAARAHPPDLLLSDVMMPGLDGFALLKALREDHATASIPIILISARAGEEAHAEGRAAGADDYLLKPFSSKELLARVESQLALAALRRSEELHRDDLRRLFMDAPVFMALLRGPDHVFELVNDAYRQLIGDRELLGRRCTRVCHGAQRRRGPRQRVRRAPSPPVRCRGGRERSVCGLRGASCPAQEAGDGGG
jgi:CheY-like chemotaxis protein